MPWGHAGDRGRLDAAEGHAGLDAIALLVGERHAGQADQRVLQSDRAGTAQLVTGDDLHTGGSVAEGQRVAR
jgi:hypothetical protein